MAKEILNEMPVDGKDLYNRPSSKEFVKNSLELLNGLKKSEKIKKFNKDYNYFITSDFLTILKGQEIAAFIRFGQDKKSFYVLNIENILKIPAISIMIYSFILTALKFDEILTGNLLSDKNIKAHKKFLIDSPVFSLFLRKNGKDTPIDSEDEIDAEMKFGGDRNAVFVLKENISVISEMYQTTSEIVLEEYIVMYFKTPKNFSEYIKILKGKR